MTSITKAIQTARENVRLSRFGGGWKVMSWSERHNAWYDGNPTQWDRARDDYMETRLRVAFEALGFSRDDADSMAWKYAEPGLGTLRERITRAVNR